MHTARFSHPRGHSAVLKRTRPVVAALAALATLVGGIGVLLAVATTPAGASTLNGVATIAQPGTTTPLTSGGSATKFTVSLPAQAACTGDTASAGYHVYSYLVPQGTAVTSVTFVSLPSTGYGLVEPTGTYYGPVNTAIGTGQIVSIPNDFEWGPLVSDDSVPLSTLLYTGSGPSATGIWETGLVCANSSGTVTDYWNTQVTFAASGADPNGFTWTAIAPPAAPSGLAATLGVGQATLSGPPRTTTAARSPRTR